MGQIVDQPAKVLIIDDEEATRYGIRRALATQGYQLEEAPDGARALETIETFLPDVVVSDINMPGMDGLSLLRAIKERDDPPLVVLITAYGSETIAVQALRAGAYDYIPKPFEIMELRTVVGHAVDQQMLARKNRFYYQELERTLSELKASQAALVQSEKLASLGRLAAGLSHEINTPLGVLKSGADTMALVARKIQGEAAAAGTRLRDIADLQIETSRQMLAASDRIQALMADLRVFSEVDGVEFRSVDINECLATALRLLETQMPGGIEIHREFANRCEIECDQAQIKQLFVSLLLNAKEAIQRAGRPGSIHIRTQMTGDTAVVEVEDTGEGIRAEDLPAIFDPSFTIKGSRIGAGLDLAIACQVAHAHGGRIDVTSDPASGSLFRVSLPVRRAEANPRPAVLPGA
jgi:signal transduction histidine kinase